MNLSHKPRPDQPNRKLSPGQSDFNTPYFFKTTIYSIINMQAWNENWHTLFQLTSAQWKFVFLLCKHYNWVAWSLDILFSIKFILIFTASWSSGNLKTLGISFFVTYHYLLHRFTTATKKRFFLEYFHEMTYIIFPSLLRTVSRVMNKYIFKTCCSFVLTLSRLLISN